MASWVADLTSSPFTDRIWSPCVSRPSASAGPPFTMSETKTPVSFLEAGRRRHQAAVEAQASASHPNVSCSSGKRSGCFWDTSAGTRRLAASPPSPHDAQAQALAGPALQLQGEGVPQLLLLVLGLVPVDHQADPGRRLAQHADGVVVAGLPQVRGVHLRPTQGVRRRRRRPSLPGNLPTSRPRLSAGGGGLQRQTPKPRPHPARGRREGRSAPYLQDLVSGPQPAIFRRRPLLVHLVDDDGPLGEGGSTEYHQCSCVTVVPQVQRSHSQAGHCLLGTPLPLGYQQGVAAPHDAQAQPRAALADVYGGLAAGDDGAGGGVAGQGGRRGRAALS